MQSATVIVPLVWRHKRKLSDCVGQSKNNANPATFPGVEPCSTNATMWPRRNGKNSEVEKERMYYEGRRRSWRRASFSEGPSPGLIWNAADSNFQKSQHSSRMEEKKKKHFPQSTDNTLKTYTVLENVRLSMCLWTTWVWYIGFLIFQLILCNKNI